MISYEWDEKKESVNFRKHGVRFEEAQTIWCDPNSLEFHDPDHSLSEQRFIRVGLSFNSRLLLVVFCERDEEHIIRIISARKTNDFERRTYERGI